MSRFSWLAFILLLGTTCGCGEATVAPEDVFKPEELQGTVDTSLSADLQAKQEALAKAFGPMIEEGADVESLPDYVFDVSFEESLEGFLEGTINLARWDFNGTPTGNDVPVVLHLSIDSSGQNERRVERVYTVTGSSGQMVIKRK